eukprot:TRINITY_DN17403_c0_g1_i3.p4 TRINITY_DN17403_c0_g1~~TRINITY_DN17403_c0_g1_i3.p4  ORF type:complete len:100 (+),score=12.21 TRINITY_DN17403_c0_g1_i3:145-444(+)
MIRRPPRSTHCISSAASDVYKRQVLFLPKRRAPASDGGQPANAFDPGGPGGARTARAVDGVCGVAGVRGGAVAARGQGAVGLREALEERPAAGAIGVAR